MKKNYFAITVCFITVVLNAQSNKPNYTRIGIGDKVPGDLPLTNLVNHSKSDATIADFKGKWLILDYWFTGCGPCIESWPKQMQLQNKFGDRIQIMGVNHMQNKEVVENFISRRNKGSKDPFLIPSATGDTILYRVLPPSGYPSLIWIDPEGIYRASTDGADLNEATIKAALENKALKTLSSSNASFINLRRPLFIDGNGGTGQQMLYYSTVSRYSTKVKEGLFLMSADSSGYVIATTHKPILDLIMRAYSEGPFGVSIVNYIRLPRTRIELRIKNPARLWSHTDNGIRLTDNLYTYQLISYEPRTMQQLKEMMADDIQKYFALEFRWEKVEKECLSLIAEDTTLLGDNRIGVPIYGSDVATDEMYIKDVTVKSLLGYLTEYIGGGYSKFDGYPLIDETGYKGGLDIVFENVTSQNLYEIFRDYKQLNKAIAKYKMRFKLVNRKVDVLVITDAKI